MNKKPYLLILILAVTGLLVSGCGTQATSSNSWAGTAVDEDTFYIANGQSVFAVRAADGSLAWRYPEKAEASRNFFAPPAVGEGQLILGDYQNTLHNVNISTGSTNWKFSQAKGRFEAGATLTNGVILAASMDRHVYALDLQGNTLWSFEAKNGFLGTPASDGERVFIPSMDHSFYALDIKSGKQLWSQDLGGAIITGAALSEDGVLYTSTLANEIVALQAADGKVLWRFAPQKAVWSTPVLHENTLYFGDLTGSVYAVDAAAGKQLWKVEKAGSAIIASGAVLTDGLVFVTEDGNIIKLSFSGEKVWTRTINGKLYSTPGVAADRIIVAVTKGDNLVQAFDANGNEQWSFVAPK